MITNNMYLSTDKMKIQHPTLREAPEQNMGSNKFSNCYKLKLIYRLGCQEPKTIQGEPT